MIGYKVVRSIYEDGNFKDVSCNINFTSNSALRLDYKDGEIVIAPQGTIGIFIFLEKAEAIYFGEGCGGCGGLKIKKVELLSQPIKVTKNILSGFSRTLITSSFTNKMYKYLLRQEGMPAPYGTYVCRKIRVIEDVKEV